MVKLRVKMSDHAPLMKFKPHMPPGTNGNLDDDRLYWAAIECIIKLMVNSNSIILISVTHNQLQTTHELWATLIFTEQVMFANACVSTLQLTSFNQFKIGAWRRNEIAQLVYLISWMLHTEKQKRSPLLCVQRLLCATIIFRLCNLALRGNHFFYKCIQKL